MAHSKYSVDASSCPADTDYDGGFELIFEIDKMIAVTAANFTPGSKLYNFGHFDIS